MIELGRIYLAGYEGSHEIFGRLVLDVESYFSIDIVSIHMGSTNFHY